MAMPPTIPVKDRQSITYTKQAPNNQLAAAVPRRWMCHTRTVIPGGAAARRQIFNVVVFLRVGCAHGCVYERAKNRPNVNVTSGSGTRAKRITPYKGKRFVHADDAGCNCCENPGICLIHAEGQTF